MNRNTILTIVAAMALMTGCVVKPPISARQDPYPRQQIHLASDDLKYHTAVDAPQVSRDDAGLLHVTVPIRATTDQQVYVDYRVTFFDRDGAELSQSGWIKKTLPPNIPDQFSVNSTTPLAQDFQIDIRYSR